MFYTGSLQNGKFNFVYDCGTENGEDLIEIQINNFVNNVLCSEQSLIDFIVISHLHKDHYSGLYYLPKKAKIKRIYFPYIFKNIDKQALQLYLYYDIFIRSLHDRRRIEKESDFQLYYFISKLLGLDVSSGENYELPEVRYSTDELPNNSLWKFYFINSEIPSGIVDEINKSCQSLLDKNKCSMTEFIERNKGNIKLIASEYERIFGNKINDTSTILFHGPQSGWYSLRCSTFKFDRFSILSRYFCCHANCLAWYRYVRGTSLLTMILTFATPKLKARYQPILRLCRCHIMAQRRTGNIIHVNHLQNCLLSLLDMEINMGIHLHGQ